MFEFLRIHQLNIMLVLSGICAILSLFVFITKTLSKKRKVILIFMELSAAFLLIFDRFAYIYRGDVSTTGCWMVRISNFWVYFLSLFVIFTFNHYLKDLFTHEGGLKTAPTALKIVDALILVGEIMIILSAFTGIYYTFDEYNQYHRAPLFIL